MSEEYKPLNPKELLHQLETDPGLRNIPVESQPLDPQLAMLRRWQSDRLSRTYADLLADKKTAPACQFFLSDIYAARDFSQRDSDAERIHAFLSRILPPYAFQHLTDSIAMTRLSYKLDNALLRVLVDQLGVTDQISPEQYAEAYRLCDNYAERRLQIDYITRILREVGEGARAPMVSLALGLAKGPAHIAGWGELYDFLVRGQRAFKSMKSVAAFAATIERREKAILDKIYARDPDPFRVDA